MSAFVVAEAAGCHDGDLRKALRLVRLAHEVGADAVKFQWLSSPERLAARRRALKYLPAYRTLAFPLAWFPLLASFCDAVGVEFMCTAYLPEDVPTVAEYVRRFKVSSFEALDRHFVCSHAEFRKPLIISAGMGADVRGVLRAYGAAYGAAAAEARVDVLYCVSAYPCPTDQICLRKLRFGGVIYGGLSDHTRHPLTGAVAVAAGARIVEFHARLEDTSTGNADFAVARPPAEAAEYVRNIRAAEELLGREDGGMAPAEVGMLLHRAPSSGA